MDKLAFIVFGLCITPLIGVADHHGTRCPVDFNQYKKSIIKPAVTGPCNGVLSESKIDAAIAADIHYLKSLGSQRKGYKTIPLIGAVYSIPVKSFATCQIKLHKKCCPALKWCYPFKHNKNSVVCGKINKPLNCVHERERCRKNPKLPECVQPPAAKERCYVNAKLPGCKKLD